MEQEDSLNVYCVFDKKMKAAGPLFLAKDEGEAVILIERSLVGQDGTPSQLAMFPEDYCLMEVASFNPRNCDMFMSLDGKRVVKEMTELVSRVVRVFKATAATADKFLTTIGKEGEE